jgi:hypothetical protein
MIKMVIIKVLVAVWIIISIVSFFIGEYVIRKTASDRDFIEELIKTERGKDLILSFGNTFSIALTCMIPLVHFVPLVGFTWGFIMMKKDYGYYKTCILSAAKGE